MAIIRGLKTGWHDSTVKIGNWSSPQEEGDDRPRGNKTYGSLDMTKGLSFDGISKKYDGLNIVNNSLTKGEAVIFGHSLILEEDIALGSEKQIILGIDREARETYIELDEGGRTPIQEELTNDFGKYEVVMWKHNGTEWKYTLPQSKTIKKFLQPTLLIKGSKNIYDIELTSVSENLINNPTEFIKTNTTLTIYASKVGDEANEDILRIRKRNSFIEASFGEWRIVEGINRLFLYINAEGKIKITTGTGE